MAGIVKSKGLEVNGQRKVRINSFHLAEILVSSLAITVPGGRQG